MLSEVTFMLQPVDLSLPIHALEVWIPAPAFPCRFPIPPLPPSLPACYRTLPPLHTPATWQSSGVGRKGVV